MNVHFHLNTLALVVEVEVYLVSVSLSSFSYNIECYYTICSYNAFLFDDVLRDMIYILMILYLLMN